MPQQKLPDWEIDSLPAPPPYTVSNLFKVIGPGAITGIVGGRKIKLSPAGKTFSITEENMQRWRDWWRYVRVDQIWTLSCAW
jgi:hypothetical protein